jgi:SpoIID/LytB domain protein
VAGANRRSLAWLRRRRMAGAVLATSVGLVGLVMGPAVGRATGARGTALAAQTAPAEVALLGYGFGHGRGMGQWGALGDAAGLQWTYQEILDHAYGGTSLASNAGNPDIRVRIDQNDGVDVIVFSNAAFSVEAAGAPTLSVPAGQAALFHLAGPGTWQVKRSGGCAGEGGWQTVETTSSPPEAVPASPETAQTPVSDLLQLCTTTGNWYLDGSIEGAVGSSGQERTVNVLSLDAYLRGVVPSESPDYWGTLGSPGPQGQAWGFQALEAQAVAARSYALSGLGELGYADICDTDYCQVYNGVATGVPNQDQVATVNEHTLSDLAVADTEGQVMVWPSGAIARTEYSSSTGGYSAGGAFPAVPDPGDKAAVAFGNPWHPWTQTVPASAIEAAWPGIGTFEALDVLSRNGLGDLGGRVLQVEVVGSAGSDTMSGQDFAWGVGLPSDWFEVTGTSGSVGVGGGGTTAGPTSSPSPGPVAQPAASGLWLGEADGDVAAVGGAPALAPSGGSLSGPAVAIAADPASSSGGAWLVDGAGDVEAVGAAPLLGDVPEALGPGRSLNRPVVGIAPSALGQGYWIAAADGGVFTFGNAPYLGSLPAILGAASLHLAAPIVGIAPTPSGQGYWLVGADGGVFTFGNAPFVGSLPGVLGPGVLPAKPITAIVPTSTGEGYWLLGADGGVFTFGDATFFGSLPGNGVQTSDALSLVPTPTGQGYWIVTGGGRVFAFGDAASLQPPSGLGSVVGAAADPG